MDRIHFIRKPSGLVLVRINHKLLPKGRFTFSTSQKITSDNWKDGGIKKDQPTRFVANYPRIRSYFQAIRDAADKHLSGRINVSKLAEELQALSKTAPRVAGFFDVWKDIIETTVTDKGQKIKPGTKRSKLQTFNKIMEYYPDLTFEDITITFYYELSQKLDETIPRTKGKHLKELKAILAQMDDRGFKVPQDYRKKSFRVPRPKADSVYLSAEEIEKIINAKDLATNLHEVRDLFVIACYCGQRFGDWHQLVPENVEDGLLKVTQEKTGHVIYIPVHTLVRKLWNKYKGLPKLITEQAFNRLVKDVVEKAELGKVRVDGALVEKHLHISSHTARRSFASNAFLEGMDTLSIRQFTGHKSESAFLAYIRLSAKEHGIKSKDHAFFSPKMKVA